MNTNLRFQITILCIITLSLTGCSLAFDEIETNSQLHPEYAVPLIEKQFRLGDLMRGLNADDYLQISENGHFEMQIKGNYSETQTLNVLTSLPSNIEIPALFTPSVAVPFPNPDGMKIDFLDLKKGAFKWKMTNNNNINALVTLVFHSLSKENAAFEITFPLLSGETYKDTLNMEGWTLKPNNLGYISISYKAVLINGREVTLDNVSYNISNLEAKRAVGYFGKIPIQLKQQNLNFEFFKKWNQVGEIYFSDPSLAITIDNGFGFPTMVKTSQAKVQKKDSSELTISSPLNQGVELKYPSLNEAGNTMPTIINLNKDNSNIVDIINAYPTSMSLALGALTNPNEQDKQSGFVLDDRGVRFKIDAKVPFITKAKDFVFQDTIDINLKDYQKVSALEFKVSTENLLPLSMSIQGYFLSPANKIIDSLVTGKQVFITQSAQTFKGQVVGSTANTTLINLDEKRFSNVKTSSKMIVKLIFSTALEGRESVYLKPDQKVFMRIGMKAKL